MTVRRVTRADWPLILRLLRDEGIAAPDEDKDADAFRDAADNYLWLDDEAGAVCRLHVNTETLNITVAWLLPAGMSRSRMAPLLLAALRDVFDNRTAVRGWRVSAPLPNGKDAAGNPDKGEGACKAWQAIFAGATVEQLPS